jgi:cell division protein FtsW (lipid II flippase)
MFFMSAYFLWNSKADKSRFIYIAYSATLLVLITIAMACNLFFGQQMWIEHRDVDGGPVAFFGGNIAAWYIIISLQKRYDGTKSEFIGTILLEPRPT